VTAGYRFALSGVTLPEGDDLFGVWDVPTAADMSFAAGVPAEPVWRAQLPSSPADARSILEAQSYALKRSQSDLETAQRRMEQLGRGVSFDAVSDPEAELWAAVNALESPVSFGLWGRKKQETHRGWNAFLEQVHQMVAHCVRAETEVGGILVGHTAVGWTGDFDTLWSPAVTTESMQLHHRTVHLALASRLALLRLLTVVGTGAAGLALKLTVPGAQLLVLPAVWKFVREVLKELRRFREDVNPRPESRPGRSSPAAGPGQLNLAGLPR